MKSPLQQAVAAALFAGAAMIAVAQQPGPTIPSTTAPTSATAPQASSEVNRQGGEPVASIAAGASAQRVQAAQGLIDALNADASLKGSKITVVPEDNGVLITGVTPSLRQMAQIVNTATQQAGGLRVTHAISTEEVVIDVGASAAGPDAMIPPDQIAVDAAPAQPGQGMQQPAAQPNPQQAASR